MRALCPTPSNQTLQTARQTWPAPPRSRASSSTLDAGGRFRYYWRAAKPSFQPLLKRRPHFPPLLQRKRRRDFCQLRKRACYNSCAEYNLLREKVNKNLHLSRPNSPACRKILAGVSPRPRTIPQRAAKLSRSILFPCGRICP